MRLPGLGGPEPRLARLKAEIARLTTDNERLRGALEQSRAELATARQAADRTEQLNALLQDQSDRTLARLQEVRAELADLVERAGVRPPRTGEIHSEFAALTTHLRDLLSDLEQLEPLSQGSRHFVSGLSERAGEIGSILALIRSIAERTNLLALNAAIEAARASQHGQGYAEIAAEVRRLADRTEAAINETGGVIEAMRGNVRRVAAVFDQLLEQLRSVVGDTEQMQQRVDRTGTLVREAIVGAERVGGTLLLTLMKVDLLAAKIDACRSIEPGAATNGRTPPESEGAQSLVVKDAGLRKAQARLLAQRERICALRGRPQPDLAALREAFDRLAEAEADILARLDRIRDRLRSQPAG